MYRNIKLRCQEKDGKCDRESCQYPGKDLCGTPKGGCS